MKEDNYKPYTAKRWTEIPVFKPAEGVPVREFTSEEKEQNERDMESILRKYGQLGDDEKLQNGKVVKIRSSSDANKKGTD